jgi:hypothetical protein
MAIQTTSTFEYNYGTYTSPYFRLVLHLPQSGQETPVDCFMYHSKEMYESGSQSITCLPFYVGTSGASTNNAGDNVINKYLLYVTEKVTEELKTISPNSTFEIVEIPTESEI